MSKNFVAGVVACGLLNAVSAKAQEDLAARKAGTVVRVDLIGDSTQTKQSGYGRGFCANMTAKVDCLNLAHGGASTKMYRERGPFKVVLTGDSTVATGGGWGPGFCATLTPNVTCVDLAANGRSTKSYIDEGLWAKALAEKGQYYFVQFGHNDQKPKADLHTDPDTTYAANLRRFIHDVREQGGIPIIVSPLSRRNYTNGKLTKDGLEAYAAAAHEVADEEGVAFVDLFALSQKYLSGLTQEQADAFDASSHPDENAENSGSTKQDRTHLNEKGKAFFGRMVADNVIRTQVELGPNVVGVPVEQAPAMRASPTEGH